MFIEKIVRRRKSIFEILLFFLIIFSTFVITYLSLVYIPQFTLIITASLIFLAYILMTRKNIEYEYAVTSGTLDIDMIINQKERKSLFCANCKEFDVVARKNSPQYTDQINKCKSVFDYTSRNKNADVWFISMVRGGKQTVILFEPLGQMIDDFTIFIPGKVFNNG